MIAYEDLRSDCRHFRWDRPCTPHKQEGVSCPGCTHLDPIQSRLLMVKLAAVGDVLRSTSLLPAIRKKYPGARITWLTQPAAAGLFPGNRQVDEVLTTADPGLMARLGVEDFDAVLCPDADPASAALAAAARARSRVGFSMDPQGRVLPLSKAAEAWFCMGVSDVHKRANRETYQTLAARALDLDPGDVGLPILNPTPEDLDVARQFRQGLQFSGPLVGLNTGAGCRWKKKRWTLAHQKTFVEALVSKGIGVLLLGGPEEAEVHRQLATEGPVPVPVPVIACGTEHSYRRFAAYAEQCQILVTGDTLALHVGCARRVPVVALFGPTSAAEIELYGRGEKIQPQGLSCLVCYLEDCQVQPHCQELIRPEMVLLAVERLLA